MRFPHPGFLAAFLAVICATAASAASLQVSPITIEVPAPGVVSSLTLQNTGTELINAQVRVMKWSQDKGEDVLVATKDVVASPPALKLTAGKKAVVRVVRLSKKPVAGEETYRLIVDELPGKPKDGRIGVSLAIRYSIPVYFTPEGAAAKVSWKALVKDGKLVLEGVNAGSGRAKIVDLRIVQDGKPLPVAGGLAGYVLAKSTRQWVVNQESIKLESGGSIKIQAMSNNVPIEATAKVSAAN